MSEGSLGRPATRGRPGPQHGGQNLSWGVQWVILIIEGLSRTFSYHFISESCTSLFFRGALFLSSSLKWNFLSFWTSPEAILYLLLQKLGWKGKRPRNAVETKDAFLLFSLAPSTIFRPIYFPHRLQKSWLFHCLSSYYLIKLKMPAIVKPGELFVQIAGISGALAVALGAYGAHGMCPFRL